MPTTNAPSPRGPVAPAAHIPGLTLYPHDHVCAFVEGQRELDELIGDYVRDGLRAGQPGLLVAGPTARPRILAMCDDVAAARREDLLQVVEPRSLFLRTGSFVPAAAFEFWGTWARATFSGDEARTARIAVDMSWAHALLDRSFIRDLVRYEARFTRWAPSVPLVCLSLYDLDEFGVAALLPLIKSQPTVWLKGVAVTNPYHVDPEDAAAPVPSA